MSWNSTTKDREHRLLGAKEGKQREIEAKSRSYDVYF